jgi:hypothetical protein
MGMLTPFLKYVSEGRVIRRQNDLQRYTFPEVTERIYISFLTLSLLSQVPEMRSFVRSYADQTMAKGTFDQVRIINNDLANMLAIVAGDPDITKKLKNKNQAQAMRQRQPVPVMAVRRYLRTWEDHYKNLRRNIANYNGLDGKNKQVTRNKLLQHLGAKLAGTDLHRAMKGAV